MTETGRPVRVLHCLWSGGIGGAERAVYQLVREQLRGTEVSPAVAFAAAGGPLRAELMALGVPVVTLDLPHGRSVRRIPAAVARMRDFDVHHFHAAEPVVMLASLLCRGVHRVYTHRGGTTDYGPRKRIRFRLTGLLLRRFDALSGNTMHAARCAAELFSLPPARFAVTYNGVEPELLQPQRTRDEARASLGLEADDYVVGTAANLRPWKRIDLLIGAVAALDEPRLRLLVLGDGVDRPRLEGMVECLGLQSRVTFAGAQHAVGDFLGAMDAFCLPSTSLESFGNAAVEAMLVGLPTIVFADGGGLVEHVSPGETGIVVSGSGELEDALRRLLDEPEWGRALGSRARAVVAERYTPARSASAYAALYRAALAGAS